MALPPQPREPSPGLQTMGPTPAAALGTRSAHPDAPGYSRGQGGEAPAWGCCPSPAHQRHRHGVMLHSPGGRREWAAGIFRLAGGPYSRARSLLIVPCPPSRLQAASPAWRVFPGRLWLLQLKHAPAQPGRPDFFAFSANKLRFAFE